MTRRPNLFMTFLTYEAPAGNYRGESLPARTTLQKISKGGRQYAVVSVEAVKNRLRERLLADFPEETNRRRIHDANQLAVVYKEFPDAAKYVDDFFFGFLVADKKAIEKNPGKPYVRNAVLQMNIARALTPYEEDTLMCQSPLINGGTPGIANPWSNDNTSALIHREVSDTAFQYPLALAFEDVKAGRAPEWTRALLRHLGELANVGGGHARHYYEMAPRSIVARLTSRLASGFDPYGFTPEGAFPDLERVLAKGLPGKEFFFGGEIVRKLDILHPGKKAALLAEGVKLFDETEQLLSAVCEMGLVGTGKPDAGAPRR